MDDDIISCIKGKLLSSLNTNTGFNNIQDTFNIFLKHQWDWWL